MTRYLVTSALPYANGPQHFGHLAGVYLPADVYVRHQRLKGEEVLHICGSDEHGVAIMLNAQKEKKDYQEYVNNWHQCHQATFDSYEVDFDHFGQTSASYHKEETLKWFHLLYEKGFIEPKDEQQLQCQSCSNNLPDRFVEGECYNCGHEKARGDECPQCGEWIEPTRLIKPVCKICGSSEIKEVTVTQLYLMLSKYQDEFEKWFEAVAPTWRKTIAPYVKSLIEKGLVDRAITRDLEWGIDVPLKGFEGKKLYVWFDAPIGYVSNTKELTPEYLSKWWQNDETKLINFIGKDNIIFHALIFPIMSLASGRAKAVNELAANQFLNLEGKQFSKSAGWYVDADEAVSRFGANPLRYYLLAISPEGNDSNFSWDQFLSKVNNELANNIGNFINRCLKFCHKNWHDGLDAKFFEGFSEQEKVAEPLQEIREHLDKIEVRKALEKVMALGAQANTYFSDQAPWAQIKTNKDEAAKTIAYSAQYALLLGIYLGPFLPSLGQEILSFFKITDEQKTKLYQGDFNILQEVFGPGLRLMKEPEALIPKIEAKLVEDLRP